MRLSSTLFESSQPYWQDYLPFLQRLAGRGFPSCEQLNALLPEGLSSAGGHAIRFVPSGQLSDDGYEHRIYTTGQVSTRPDHWHDLFNALVWMRYPRIKVAMNALHYRAGPLQADGKRGCLRDALTLFDECGVIVISDQPDFLAALAQRRWLQAFQTPEFSSSVTLSVCGHAMLEKYLSPYKSMTAKALLIHVSTGLMNTPRPELLRVLDTEISTGMLNGHLLTRPACLTPLPLAGVPGWWPEDEQSDDDFYLDTQVFRAPPSALTPTPIIQI